jgi:LAS superfamily LD-carboxypeptidase LdcB
MPLDPLQLTGRSRSHLFQSDEPRFAIHANMVEPFARLREAAAREGFDIAVFSGFRDFESQAEIWNQKFRGERTLFDADGAVLDYRALSEAERVQCILNWSALPGASRHHWGTDIDVYDRAALPEGYRVKLLPEEVGPGGVFHRLHSWLDQNMARFGFFRPYREYRGGMFPEAWHLSYAPIAMPALEVLTLDVVAQALRDGEILGKDLVLERLPEIYQRHVLNISLPISLP